MTSKTKKTKAVNDLVSSKQVGLIGLHEKLEALRDQLGKTLAHPSDDKPKDDGMLTVLRRDIQDTQTTIDEETLRISQLERDATAMADNDKRVVVLLKQQRKLSEEMVELSKELVASLILANDVNEKLKTLEQKYRELKAKTQTDTLPLCYAAASNSWLNAVTSILVREAKGERPGRVCKVNLPI